MLRQKERNRKMAESKEKKHVTPEQEIQMIKDIQKALYTYLDAYNEYLKTGKHDWPRDVFKTFVNIVNLYLDTDGRWTGDLYNSFNVPVHGIGTHHDNKDVHDGAVRDIEKKLNEYLGGSEHNNDEKELVNNPKDKSYTKSNADKNNFRDAVAAVLDKYDEDKKVAKKKKEENLLEQIFGKTNQ